MNLFGNGNDSAQGPPQPPTLILPNLHTYSVRLKGTEVARVTAQQVGTDTVGSLVFVNLFIYGGDALPYKSRIFAAGTWDDCEEVPESVVALIGAGSTPRLTP